MADQDEREKKRGRPRKTQENSVADILKEKNITRNEINEKERNRKERTKIVHE